MTMTDYKLVKAVAGQGRVESNIMRSGQSTHRFTTNALFSAKRQVHEKASCHVRGLSDQQAAAAFEAFYDAAVQTVWGAVSVLSEQGRRGLQAAIISHAGTGTPGVIRVHSQEPKEDAAPIPDQSTVTLDALRAIEADTNLTARARGEAMHYLLHNGAQEATPAMIAAMAYTQAMDKATKARR
jgi:hypothetical protein